MTDARSWFSSLEQTDFNDKSLEILFNEHDFYRKEILEASLATLNEGQCLLQRIKDLGSLTESTSQHSTIAACYEVEHLLGLHQDERHQFEDEWERNRKLIQEYIQMSLVREDIDQVRVVLFISIGQTVNIFSRSLIGYTIEEKNMLKTLN